METEGKTRSLVPRAGGDGRSWGVVIAKGSGVVIAKGSRTCLLQTVTCSNNDCGDSHNFVSEYTKSC